MKYNFDVQVNRRGTDSVKWDLAAPSEIAMWVADMDFAAPPAVLEALKDRLEHGIFGYNILPDAWYNAYISWWKRRHGFEMKKEWLLFCTGIVPAISSMIRQLTAPDEKVLIQSPVYNVFINAVKQNGRELADSELVYNRETGEYSIDFADLEEKLSDPKVRLMIICNPHNPIGRIWTRQELSRIGELCLKYDVTVISDEIHCDITRPGCTYTPFASISEACCNQSIICLAPTKAFNLAGLKSAAVSAADPNIREMLRQNFVNEGVNELETFAAPAAIAAFDKSEDWLDELNGYLFENRRVFEEYVRSNISSARVVPGDATCLIWLDIRDAVNDPAHAANALRDQAGIFVSAGDAYGPSGCDFLRVNIACPRSTMLEGLERLKNGLELIKDR